MFLPLSVARPLIQVKPLTRHFAVKGLESRVGLDEFFTGYSLDFAISEDDGVTITPPSTRQAQSPFAANATIFQSARMAIKDEWRQFGDEMVILGFDDDS